MLMDRIIGSTSSLHVNSLHCTLKEVFKRSSDFATASNQVAIGNHEYGYSYEDSSDSDNDPSGVSEPYQPYWGNFGDDSRGETFDILFVP
jgi:hypothetical protein